MPSTKTSVKENPKTSTRTNSPFKSHKEFEEEIRVFANKFRTTVINQASRTSDYFEMSCFNYIVGFYEKKGFKVSVKNLIKGEYRYKCSPAGQQRNFSHFQVSMKIDNRTHRYEIHHNLAVQSSHDDQIFTTPDISIIKHRSIRYTDEYYDIKRQFSYVEKEKIISFCEVKQFNPFPELLFNFIGVLNEIKKEYLTDDGLEHIVSHIAPSLMVSGKPNKQTNRIKKSLEDRYNINIIYDLFYSAKFTFSKGNIDTLRVTGKKQVTS